MRNEGGVRKDDKKDCIVEKCKQGQGSREGEERM